MSLLERGDQDPEEETGDTIRDHDKVRDAIAGAGMRFLPRRAAVRRAAVRQGICGDDVASSDYIEEDS